MKTKILYVYSLLVFGLSGCSPEVNSWNGSQDQTFIIGGTAVNRHDEAAKHAVLLYDEETQNICTGVLIHPRVVLTAAHCVSREITSITLAFGLDPLSGNYLKRRSDTVLIHDEYAKKQYLNRHDLALIRMSQDAPPTHIVAQLPPAEFPLKAGYHFTAIGYGRTTEKAGDIRGGSGQLREVVLRIDDFNSERRQFKVDQSYGKGVCSGDSGGPAMMRFKGKNYVVGIASAVWWPDEIEPVEKCNHMSIYMNMQSYRSWVEDNLVKILKK